MKKSILASLILGLFVVYSCDSSTDENPQGNAKVTVKLTDAPALYDAVNIDIQKIEFNNDNEWSSLNVNNPGIYNLLEFRNGLDVLLATATLPAGKISQMRMILGPNSTVVKDGITYPLQTPSGMQSGLKFNWNLTLEPNGAYNVWIDFDAGRSIVRQGNGKYSLKPVIRTFSELTDGQIKGYVKPQEANAAIHVINGNDTIATALPNLDGFYMFRGVPEANYNVSFDADSESSYIDQTKANVIVTYGKVTDLGTTTLTK